MSVDVLKIAFFKGKGNWKNAIIRWWTGGPYSHSETITEESVCNNYFCYTSDPKMGGIRKKWRQLDPAEWDFVEIEGDREAIIKWYEDRMGAGYDTLGLLGFVWRRENYDKDKYFCSEANAASLGIEEAWRYDPNSLKPIIDALAAYQKRK